MKHPKRGSYGRAVLGLSALLLTTTCSAANAQYSMFSESLVAANNLGGQFSYLDFSYQPNNSAATAGATKSFTGTDSTGNTQTMTFTGNTFAQSNYGRLRVMTNGSLTNSYYNATNPDYADANGNVIGLGDGSPSTLTSLGFATFTDTLQYGGSLQSGYKARYIFHVDGTNSGNVAAADPNSLANGANLAVDIDGNSVGSFFAFSPGYYSNTWVTNTFDVNGITPQKIYVQFSTQTLFNLFNLTDGGNYDGKADFSSTLTLEGIEVLDSNGNRASGWTVSSASGTQYNTLQVPEPGSLAMLVGVLGTGIGVAVRRRRG